MCIKYRSYTITILLETLHWHEYCTLLGQLRRQNDVVRFLHLFKFGLVVFTEFVSGRRAAVGRLPLVFVYFCKNYDCSRGVAELPASYV